MTVSLVTRQPSALPAVAKSNTGLLVVVVTTVVGVASVAGVAGDGVVVTGTAGPVDSVVTSGLVAIVLLPARPSLPHAAIAAPATAVAATMVIAERKVMSTSSHRSGSFVSSQR